MLDNVEDISSRKSIAEGRDKREKFVHFATARTRNAIRAIRVIGKLGNKAAYEYTADDVKKIVSALNKEIETMKARMSRSGGKDFVDFEL